MNMGIAQVVLKTMVSTIDVLLAIAVVRADEAIDGLKKAFVLIVLLNVMGVWI